MEGTEFSNDTEKCFVGKIKLLFQLDGRCLGGAAVKKILHTEKIVLNLFATLFFSNLTNKIKKVEERPFT